MKLSNIYNIAIAGLLAVSSLTACSDFLDVRPAGEKVEGELFETPKGFEEAIYGVYGSMSSESLYGKELLWGLTEVMAQNLYCEAADMKALAKYEYDNEYVRQRFSAVWTAAYKTIGYANNVIKNLDGRDDIPYNDIYLGEMLAVRALMHFDILRIFASTDKSKTGIPYAETWDFSVKPFLTVGDDLKKIEADLLRAEKLLAENDEAIMTFPHDNNQYDAFMNWRETHMNVWAVRALLARMYWYSGDMANAAKYATMVIKSGVFPLVDETEVATYLAGVLSAKETIFGIYAPKYLATSQKYLYNWTSYQSYAPYSESASDGTTSTGVPCSWQAVYNKDIATTAQDFRLKHFDGEKSPIPCLKLFDKTSVLTGTTERKDCIAGVTVMHVSELYLIAAEALLESDYDAALGYFNDEIASRGLSRFISTEQTPLTVDNIYNEYHKELFCEGQMWFNMKRLGKDIESNAEKRTIPASENLYVVPVPAGEYEYRN